MSLFNQLGRNDRAIGKYQTRPLSFFRRLLAESLDAIPPSHSMMALLEIDITEARKALQTEKERGKGEHDPDGIGKDQFLHGDHQRHRIGSIPCRARYVIARTATATRSPVPMETSDPCCRHCVPNSRPCGTHASPSTTHATRRVGVPVDEELYPHEFQGREPHSP